MHACSSSLTGFANSKNASNNCSGSNLHVHTKHGKQYLSANMKCIRHEKMLLQQPPKVPSEIFRQTALHLINTNKKLTAVFQETISAMLHMIWKCFYAQKVTSWDVICKPYIRPDWTGM